MPEVLISSATRPSDAVGRWLLSWSRWSALAGSLVLFAICLESVYSVVGRWLFDEPVMGDVELVQIGCTLAISSFLPYCQMKNGHVIVDFFTQQVSVATRCALDRLAALLLAVVAAVLAWQSGIGTLDAYHSGETSMILDWPLWWAYLTIAPGFALLCLTALYSVWKGPVNGQGEGA